MFEQSGFADGQFETGGSRVRGAWARIRAGVVAVIMLLGGASAIVIYFAGLPSAELSSDTQANGVRRTGVIQLVDNIPHIQGDRHHHSTSYTAQVQVHLTAPVGGQTQTWVHVPRYEDASAGTSITVLVDPKDPSYAELPGSPAEPSSPLTLLLPLIGALAIVFGIVAGVWAVLPRRHSRR